MATGLHNTLVLFPLYWKDVCIVFVFSQSGYNESLLKAKRHQLHESPRGLTPFWTQILTETLHCIELKHFTLYFWMQNTKNCMGVYTSIYFYNIYIYMNLFGTSTSRSQRLRRSFTSPSTTSGGLWTRGKSREHAGQGWGGTRKLGQDMLTNAAWQFGWFKKAQSNLGLQPKFAQNTDFKKHRWDNIYIYICGSKPVLKVTDQMLQNMLTTFTNGCLAQTNVLLILFLCHCQLHHKFWTKPAWKFEA